MLQPDTPLELINDSLHRAKQNLKDTNLDPMFHQYIDKALSIGSGLQNYLALAHPNEHPLLQYIRRFSIETDWEALHKKNITTSRLTAEMIVDHPQAQFLNFLRQMINAKQILEIGMFTGYTTTLLALNSGADSHITTIEQEPYLADFVKKTLANYNLNEKVSICVSDALTKLDSLQEPFDFIFIDADKINYLNYLRIILDNKLLSQQGLICVDNTLMKGSVYSDLVLHQNAEVIRTFNEAVKTEKRIQYVLLPIRDGLTLIRWHD